MTTRKIVLFVLIAGLATSAVMAQGFYVGAGIGQAYQKADSGSANLNLDGDATGWKAFGGYEFLKFFGLEASYNDFGSVDDQNGNVKFQTDATSWNVMALGHLRPAFLDLFAKVGYAYVDSTAKASSQGSASDSNWDFMWGAGVGFVIGSKFELRAEYEEYDFNPNYNGFEPNSDLYMISASALIRF